MKETLTSDLVLCPFCGGVAEFEEIESKVTHGAVMWSVGCMTEGCYGWQSHAKFNTKREAAAGWNMRKVWPVP